MSIQSKPVPALEDHGIYKKETYPDGHIVITLLQSPYAAEILPDKEGEHKYTYRYLHRMDEVAMQEQGFEGVGYTIIGGGSAIVYHDFELVSWLAGAILIKEYWRLKEAA